MRFQPVAVVRSDKGRYGVLFLPDQPEPIAKRDYDAEHLALQRESKKLQRENRELKTMNAYLRKECKDLRRIVNEHPKLVLRGKETKYSHMV